MPTLLTKPTAPKIVAPSATSASALSQISSRLNAQALNSHALCAIEHGRNSVRGQEVRVRRVTGFDRDRGRFPSRLAEQCRYALANGAESLESAGLTMQDVVRVVYLVHDADAFPACFPLLRNAFGDARPASTLRLVDGFDSPDVMIELELFACGQPPSP